MKQDGFYAKRNKLQVFYTPIADYFLRAMNQPIYQLNSLIPKMPMWVARKTVVIKGVTL